MLPAGSEKGSHSRQAAVFRTRIALARLSVSRRPVPFVLRLAMSPVAVRGEGARLKPVVTRRRTEGIAMSTDAIVLLKEDHKEVRRLFRAFEAAGENAKAAKADLVKKIIEERHVADLLCAELDAMGPDDERFDAKTTALIESVGHPAGRRRRRSI